LERDTNRDFEEALSGESFDRISSFLEYAEFHKNKKETGSFFQTGLIEFDGLTDGLGTGELCVISGPTGNGKTLFAESIGQRLMRRHNINIAWFSYEVPTSQMIKKYLNAPDAESLGLYVPMELKAGNVDWLKRKCLEAKIKYNCQAIFIDHIHFLVDMSTKQNMSLNIGGVMRQIKKEIAVDLDMLVFIICHQGQPRDEEPSIENIRDSSFIGQESDFVFVVFRSPDPLPDELKENGKIKGYPRSYEQKFATIKIEKARRSGVYRKKILFRKNGEWLEEALSG